MSDLPKFSVIVPTYNSAQYLEACLISIKSQSYQNIELIVVDNNSTDHTKQIARKYTDKVFNRGPERSAQRNYGVSQSDGDYVLIIDSDMELGEKIVESCVSKFTDDPNLRGLVIPEESFGEGFWAQCKKLERSFYVGVSWMEAARAFPRQIFDDMNGYDEENTGTEDYDLPQRIAAKYGAGAIGRINEFIRHNEQHINLFKTCKKKYYYAQRLDKYISISANNFNFHRQANPFYRYLLFFSNPQKLLKNPFTGIGLLVMKTAEFTAGGLGYLKSVDAWM